MPSFLFSAMLLGRNAESQERITETLVLGTVGALVQTVEREISANITTLRVLATSPTLASGDYRGFHERARLALAGTGANIFVMDRNLDTLLSTRRDYDDIPVRTADPASAELAFTGGAVVVSDVLVGAESRRLVYNILMPVAPPEGQPVVVALNQEAAGLSGALLAIGLPPGWEVGLVDSKGTLVAGSPGAGETGSTFRFAGGPAMTEATGWQAVRAANETVRIITRRSPLANWTLVAWAPERIITEPLVISIAWLFGGGFLVGLATIAAIYWLSLRIGRSVKLLAEDAQRLGSGQAVPRRAYPITEIETVADAIGEAADARQAALAEIRFLMRELAHRSKNQMTVIAAMAKQTARSATSVPDFVAAFERRIMGLAGSTDLLLAHGMAGVELGALLRRQLEPFCTLDTGRVQVSGPAVRLNAQSAQIVGMAAHELATNAVKYGAFASEAGRLTVDWSVDGAVLVLLWREHVPVPPQAGTRRGFGTTVLETMVGRSLDAEVTSTLHPDGMEWRFHIPLASLDPVRETPADDTLEN